VQQVWAHAILPPVEEKINIQSAIVFWISKRRRVAAALTSTLHKTGPLKRANKYTVWAQLGMGTAQLSYSYKELHLGSKAKLHVHL
jgi:hypothetical protein